MSLGMGLHKVFSRRKSMSNFRTLELAKAYYKLGSELKLPIHLKDQFARSSSSIALNLAEGNAKSSKRDRLRIFDIAYGSFRESQTILDLAGITDAEILKTQDQLGANLYQLMTAIKKML